MNRLLEKRNTIYGALAMWIIVFHIYRKISMPYIPIVTNIVGIGNMSVDVFFFFSGLCLTLSAKRHNYQKNGWGGYYRRRFARIIIPYLIICVPYYLWSAIFESSGGIMHKAFSFVFNLSSLSFWLNGMQTTWYAYGIILFYVIFPPLFKFILQAKTNQKVLLIASFILFSIFVSYAPVIKNSLVVWARLPIFIIGICEGLSSWNSEKQSQGKVVISTIVLVVLAGLTSFSEISEEFMIPQVYRLLLYIPMTLTLLVLISLSNTKIPIFEWIGGLSLEAYLIHITLLHPLKYYGIIDVVGYWLYVILPIATLLISWIVVKIEAYIISKLGV